MKKVMKIGRLLKLAKRLDQVKPERFEITTWYGRNKCGTVACVLGHAGLMPEFRALGLKTERQGFVTYKDEYGFDAGEAFFGLNDEQAWHLFSTFGYVGDVVPAMAAEKIRQMVAKEKVRRKKLKEPARA